MPRVKLLGTGVVLHLLLFLWARRRVPHVLFVSFKHSVSYSAMFLLLFLSLHLRRLRSHFSLLFEGVRRSCLS